MKFKHLRHASSILTYNNKRLLIDPMLSPKESFPAIPLTPTKRMNPLVDLSTDIKTITNVDMILSTHAHLDHFDPAASKLLDKTLQFVHQQSDAEVFEGYGFTNLIPVEDLVQIDGITITRINAQHGFDEMIDIMGPTSGYILQADNEPTIYLAGDTVYTDSVEETLSKYRPDIVILNGGSPKFLNSQHIVMNILDIEKTLTYFPNSHYIIVHLDTMNHCIETREDLREYFTLEKLKALNIKDFFIPEDNESKIYKHANNQN